MIKLLSLALNSLAATALFAALAIAAPYELGAPETVTVTAGVHAMIDVDDYCRADPLPDDCIVIPVADLTADELNEIQTAEGE